MEELRVPKRRIEVELLLHGQSPSRFAVFLGEFAEGHVGSERLSDLLNGASEFFPALELSSNTLLFVHRVSVVYARLPLPLEAELEEQDTIPTEHEVRVGFADGQRIEGLVTFVLPPDRSRLIDYLNEKPPFFRLVDKQQATLINKRYVSHVQLLER